MTSAQVEIPSVLGNSAVQSIVFPMVIANCIAAALFVLAYWNWQLAQVALWPTLWALLASVALWPVKHWIIAQFKHISSCVAGDQLVVWVLCRNLIDLLAKIDRKYVDSIRPAALPLLRGLYERNRTCARIAAHALNVASLLTENRRNSYALQQAEQPDALGTDTPTDPANLNLPSPSARSGVTQASYLPPVLTASAADMDNEGLVLSEYSGGDFMWALLFAGYVAHAVSLLYTHYFAIFAGTAFLYILTVAIRYLRGLPAARRAAAHVADFLAGVCSVIVAANAALWHVPGDLALSLFRLVRCTARKVDVAIVGSLGCCVHSFVALFLIVALAAAVGMFSAVCSYHILDEWRGALSETRVLMVDVMRHSNSQFFQHAGVQHAFSVSDAMMGNVTWNNASDIVETAVELLNKSMPAQAANIRTFLTLVHSIHETLASGATSSNATDVEVASGEFLVADVSDPCAWDHEAEESLVSHGWSNVMGYLRPSCIQASLPVWISLTTDEGEGTPEFYAMLDQHINNALQQVGLQQYAGKLSVEHITKFWAAPWDWFADISFRATSLVAFLITYAMTASFSLLASLVSFALFLNLLFYLLSNEESWLHAIISKFSPNQGEDAAISTAFSASVQQIFSINMKVCAYHIMFTVLIFHAFQLRFMVTTMALSALGAVIPLFPVYLLAVPPSMELSYRHGSLLVGICFFMFYVFVLGTATWYFYGELKRGHPSVLGLSIIAGMTAFGLQGAVLGPVLMSVFVTTSVLFAERMQSLPSFFSTPEGGASSLSGTRNVSYNDLALRRRLFQSDGTMKCLS